MGVDVKIACNIPNMNDGTSLYRAMGPLGELRRRKNISTHHLGIWSLATLMEVDILFMQRPYKSDHVEIFNMAKDLGVPVWVDYDDLLMSITTDNPQYFTYSAPDKMQNMHYILEHADAVTVSTKELHKYFSKVNKNVTVVPNAMDMRYRIFRDRPAVPPKREKTIVWRGSRTHERDVFSVCQSIMDVSQKNKDWFFHFFGDNLWLVTDNMPHERTIVSPPAEWNVYLANLAKARAAAMIVPLHDHPFNRCKSNIAWMEAAFAGTISIAPDFPEWDVPGVIRYTNEAQFKAAMEGVIEGGIDLQRMAADAWSYIQENLTLEKVNKKRAEVIDSLMR